MNKPDIRVCFLGDSFTHGSGDDTALGWVGRVIAAERGRGLNLTGYNLGVRGETGAQIAERVAEVAVRLGQRGDKRGLTICLGANDAYLNRPVEESIQALDGMLSWAVAEDFTAFVLSAPPMADATLDAKREVVRKGLAQVCRDHAAPFLNLPDAVDDWSAWHAEAEAGDAVHPNAEGYARVAAAFTAWNAWRDWLDGQA